MSVLYIKGKKKKVRRKGYEKLKNIKNNNIKKDKRIGWAEKVGIKHFPLTKDELLKKLNKNYESRKKSKSFS